MKAVSLFANVGIAETYFNEIGIDVIVANELLPERAKFYSHLYPETNMICGDITDKKIYDEIISEAKTEKIDILI
jgi:DNA (cytosine-5)-methyltransferase 1